MTQDTRKDKRAKVVSLNVRYKSATVDEFIENHSHDVSKGGLFVKTPTPFPPGTLLKFEIRLAGDKSMLSGVGRVVWKREPTQAGADKPAGMGVKFIKVDDPSRAVIDRLIAQKSYAGSAYTSEEAIEDAPLDGHAAEPRSPVNVPAALGASTAVLPVSQPPAAVPRATGAPPPAAARTPRTVMGVAPAAGPPPPGPAAAPAARPSPPKATESKPAAPDGAAPPPRRPARRATMLGMAPLAPPPGATAAPAAQASAARAAEPMFPTLDPESETEPFARDQTVMKQAAELLEEALKEAGGSLEEIEHNPLFAKPADAPIGGDSALTSVGAWAGDGAVMASPSAGRTGTEPSPAPMASFSLSPSQASSPSHAQSSSASAPSLSDPPRKLGDQLDLPRKRGGGVGVIVGVLLVLLVGGGGVYAWKSGLLGGAPFEGNASNSAASSPVAPSAASVTTATLTASPRASPTAPSADTGSSPVASASNAVARGATKAPGPAVDAERSAAPAPAARLSPRTKPAAPVVTGTGESSASPAGEAPGTPPAPPPSSAPPPAPVAPAKSAPAPAAAAPSTPVPEP